MSKGVKWIINYNTNQFFYFLYVNNKKHEFYLSILINGLMRLTELILEALIFEIPNIHPSLSENV